MRQVCSFIAGVVTALTLAGCSETPPETGTVQFKGTQNPAIETLRENMSKNAAGGKIAKGSEAPAKATPETKAADVKAAPDAKDTEKKKD